MNLVNDFISFLNINSGALAVLLNAILVSITGIYVFLTYKLAKNSNQTVQDARIDLINKKKREEAIKKNLIYLINSEILQNSFIYVFSQYYLLNKKEVNLKERLRQFWSNGRISVDSTSKGHIIAHTKLDTWREIRGQCSQYFSNELMQELTGYYFGVEHSKIYSIKGMQRENFIELCNNQLISTYKCLEILRNEVEDLRIIEEYKVGKKTLRINKEKGILIESSEG
ncbi:hypothetical protein [Planococcus lenghuensis]|uniref:Uncharacterized protein n=1 Tax=Planococcus lenghuensis TaxID=2213202 RepID=A0A1Q2L4N5_9BACL|nr:hypothetical protein [Planococcus lenghuensis]AQQ55418.1 hypothetical protein B0X71_19830 [Planococcus lenghuensis]